MCEDKDCVYRFVLEEQFRQDIIRQYKDRHERMMGSPGYPTVEVDLPSSARIAKMVKKRLDYTAKYWNKHRPY